jgi:UDP-GlcNAc:undecaprenyl-phosphate GlcNAc-1-phosphate transferase
MILLFFLVALVIFYFVHRGTKFYGFTDKPDGLLKNHAKATSIGGGMAIILIYSAMQVITPISTIFDLHDFATIWAIFILGIIDDKYRLGYTIKLVIQGVLVSLYIYFQGTFPVAIGLPLIISLIVLLNSINIIDNYNGVSGFLYTYSILVIALYFNYPAITVLGLIFPLVVFLFYNHRAPGNSLMFMGNNGSYAFGMILCILFLKSTKNAYSDFSLTEILNLFAIAGVVFLPFIVDTLVVMMVRIYRGMNPLRGSHDHLSHILLDFGVKPRMIAPLLFLFFVLFAGATFMLPSGVLRFVWVALSAVVLIVVLVNYRIRFKYAK